MLRRRQGGSPLPSDFSPHVSDFRPLPSDDYFSSFTVVLWWVCSSPFRFAKLHHKSGRCKESTHF